MVKSIEPLSSGELMGAGRLPPCRIDDLGGAPVLGSGCEGTPDIATTNRLFDHGACMGWWPEASAAGDAPGFRCCCDCHATEHGWPGWDRHLTG